MSEEEAAAPTPAPTPAPAVRTAEHHARAVNRMRRQSLGQLVLLLIQIGLGMYVNIYTKLPDADQGKGVMASFGNALSKGPAAVASHTGLGLLIVINACVLLVFSFSVRSVSAKIFSLLGLVGIVGAAFSGASFVNATVNSSQANGASMGMTVAGLVAVLCYGINLFALGHRGSAATAEASAES